MVGDGGGESGKRERMLAAARDGERVCEWVRGEDLSSPRPFLSILCRQIFQSAGVARHLR
jgi:hypothetical protein